MHEKHTSNVNWRKLLHDFRAAYQVEADWEILISELIANALDAGARRIEINVIGICPKYITIIDDGKGMSKNEFEDYHDLGSIAKTKGKSIGWAGIGAKLYIDKCDEIYTETKSSSFKGASNWYFPESEKAPIWEEVEPIGLLPHESGTAIRVTISDQKECALLQETEIEGSILGNYNYAIKPLGETEIYLNEKKIKPFDPRENAEYIEEFDVSIGKNKIKAHCVFALLRDNTPPGFSLISIIVHKKIVESGYAFKQDRIIKDPDRITGFVECDHLVEIITTSKDRLNEKTMLWKNFQKAIGKKFFDWLSKTGQRIMRDADSEDQQLAKEIENIINEILNDPTIQNMGLNPFLKPSKADAFVKSTSGDIPIDEIEGQQISGGVSDGPKGRIGIEVPGPDEGKSYVEEIGGEHQGKKSPRRMRSGIKIVYQDLEDENPRYYLDPGLEAIVINKTNPAFKCAEILGAVHFCTIELCIQFLCEAKEDDKTKQDTVNILYKKILELQ